MAAKVLLVSPYGNEIAGCFRETDIVQWRTEMPDRNELIAANWIVLYGCRKKVGEPWLSTFKNRIINIHISYLPYNRGADPNFWSWFDNTPKGITVHEVDAGIDTGRIIHQSEVFFKAPEKHTLKTSYDTLRKTVPTVFKITWDEISNGSYHPTLQREDWIRQPVHKSADKTKWMDMLPMKWDTPVLEVQQLGEWQQ